MCHHRFIGTRVCRFRPGRICIFRWRSSLKHCVQPGRYSALPVSLESASSCALCKKSEVILWCFRRFVYIILAGFPVAAPFFFDSTAPAGVFSCVLPVISSSERVVLALFRMHSPKCPQARSCESHSRRISRSACPVDFDGKVCYTGRYPNCFRGSPRPHAAPGDPSSPARYRTRDDPLRLRSPPVAVRTEALPVPDSSRRFPWPARSHGTPQGIQATCRCRSPPTAVSSVLCRNSCIIAGYLAHTMLQMVYLTAARGAWAQGTRMREVCGQEENGNQDRERLRLDSLGITGRHHGRAEMLPQPGVQDSEAGRGGSG